jgi:hypothetical protein
MTRVLQPGGRLILVDHIESTSRLVRAVQRALEVVTVPLGGEDFGRRPLNLVRAATFDMERSSDSNSVWSNGSSPANPARRDRLLRQEVGFKPWKSANSKAIWCC